ncbi:signal peptide peptidase-like protein [Phytophthora infestans T30-4]|uniref:Signal peptide peptidase-like protein n=1 Tax=Phytophthora infestans (strain T30-4) TaxID=403677 RepID=D0NJT1_PHYIT|nr:signal peptide peptidase-like protein [Phytophthora infestans T30-4]EEY60017.1 signal peptide peptidase-like protein [Phytophthora infestans T30-4]|eukprot:XP_002900702.1 signal peptide peptidase-like protein [Phytophthora infestans T30-4]
MAPLAHVLLPAALMAASCTATNPANSILSAVVNVKKSEAVFYASSAAEEDWGASLEAQKLKDGGKHAFYPLVYNAPGLGDGYGCVSKEKLLDNTSSGNMSASSVSGPASATLLGLPDHPFVLLVDRGGCTFAEKAYYAQELGAAVLIVTDTLEQLYNRSNKVGVSQEEKQMELSCSRGSGKADWNADITDFTSTSWEGDVGVRSCRGNNKCSSHMCVPSGGLNKQVCCAWDIPDLMGFGTTDVVTDKSLVSDIIVVRISIADGDSLKEMLTTGSEDEDGQLLISVYERDPPVMDPAQVILWIVACATVLMGSYKGSAYERTKAQLKAALIAADATSSDAIAQARVAYEEHDEQIPEQEQLDLNSWHALAFLVLGSGFLVLLFFVNVVIVVVALFGVGAVSATFQVIWEPLMRRLPVNFLHKLPWRDVLWQWEDLLVPAAWSVGDLLALVLSFGIALFWFLTRFQSYSWVFQDLFGVCFCLVFLRTARLPNLKVATVLLVLVFMYDVFMVFISPYIFKESVMIKVATGGAQSTATGGVSSGYCLRYPTDTKHDCRSESMPILLRVPKVLDWRSGFSLLGLGDIVLPGLLLVFCARYDYATRGQLFGRLKPPHGKMFGRHPQHLCRRGLFCLLMWGYTIGLLLANVAVVTTGSGQPALMYLVPCTLGLLASVGWRRGILSKLWEGPPELIPGYARRESSSSGGGLDINDVTRLRGLSLEPSKAPTSELVLLQQQQSDTPVSASYASENTPMRRDSPSSPALRQV